MINDIIYKLIQKNLTDDLRRKPWKGNPDPLAGHCYVASEAYYHLCGGKEAGLKPMCGNINGVTHWWLVEVSEKHPSGLIIDITGDQFYELKDWSELHRQYSIAKGKGFLTRQPSKRAQILIDRVTLAAYVN